MKKTLTLLTLLLTFQIIKAELWTFVPDSLHQSEVTSFAEDKFGWYWLGSMVGAAGVIRWNGVDSLEQYKPSNFPLMPGLLTQVVGSDEGDIFITGTDGTGGLLHFDTTGTFHYYDTTNSGLETNSGFAYFYDPQRGLWVSVGTAENNNLKIQYFDGDSTWSTTFDSSHVDSPYLGTCPHFIDNTGEIWVCAGATFEKLLPNNTTTNQLVNIPNGNPTVAQIYSMVVTEQGEIWSSRQTSTSPFKVVYWDQNFTWNYYGNNDFGIQTSAP